MSLDRVRSLLEQMLEATRLVQDFTEGMAFEDFVADKRTQQAVLMNLIILGEAATRLVASHGDMVARHPDVPWNGIRGMRNRVAHGYFEINLQVVWDTAQHELPSCDCSWATSCAITIKTPQPDSALVPIPAHADLEAHVRARRWRGLGLEHVVR